mmetsp:Transcript_6357/g.15313  ORF Transcript_6357/g.15313 Transcript_6357/m.15313 type:complete len:207 (+) Transcript_6357:1319-1939(+)
MDAGGARKASLRRSHLLQCRRACLPRSVPCQRLSADSTASHRRRHLLLPQQQLRREPTKRVPCPNMDRVQLAIGQSALEAAPQASTRRLLQLRMWQPQPRQLAHREGLAEHRSRVLCRCQPWHTIIDKREIQRDRKVSLNVSIAALVHSRFASRVVAQATTLARDRAIVQPPWCFEVDRGSKISWEGLLKEVGATAVVEMVGTSRT